MDGFDPRPAVFDFSFAAKLLIEVGAPVADGVARRRGAEGMLLRDFWRISRLAVHGSLDVLANSPVQSPRLRPNAGGNIR
jgi:hypothetical protein